MGLMKSLVIARSQSGQVGLVVLLVMTALLSVGISAVSRSTSDLKVTRQEAEATQVFNAAEAGIEEGLAKLETSDYDPGELTVGGDIEVDYEINQVNDLEISLFQGTVVYLDTNSAGNGDSLRIQWARDEDCSSNAAAVVVVIYNSVAGTVRREGYTRCDRSDGFVNVGAGSGGYFAAVSIPLIAGDDIVRVRPYYNDTTVYAQAGGGGWSMPTQYYQVRAAAQRQEGAETKVIEVRKSLPTLPSVFDFAILSGTTIIK